MKIITSVKPLITSLFFSISISSIAMDLESAKQQGLIGEKSSGFLGIPNQQQVSNDVIKLIKSVNNKRKIKYAEIAEKNNLNPADVAKLGYKKAVEKTSSGNYYQDSEGRWLKK